MWMGGNVPLGYDVRERKLVVSEAEASTVRMIFQRYAELGTVALLKAELERAGIVSKRREGAAGCSGQARCRSARAVDSDGARLSPRMPSRRASGIDTMSRRRLSLAVAPSIP